MMPQPVKLPKPVFLGTSSDFPKFEENLKSLAEKFLSPDWEWTFKVEGKVQREIEKRDSLNEGVYIIKQTIGKRKDIFFETPKREENKHDEMFLHTGESHMRTPKRVPPPPPPPAQGISKAVAEVMGKRAWQVEKMKEEEDRFFKINKNEFEDRELLQARKEIWDWCVLCVQGEHKNLFCAHLVKECDKWDIQQLYTLVKQFLHTENYREYGERLEKFFTAKPKEGEDIFSFISRMNTYEENISHLQHLAEEAGETLKMPKFCRVWKILSAIEKYPDYRIFTEKVQLMSPKEWIVLSPEYIRAELHKLHSNKVSLQTQKQEETQREEKQKVVGLHTKVPPPPPPRGEGAQSFTRNERVDYKKGGRSQTPSNKQQTNFKPRANTPVKFNITDQLKFFGCPEGECLGFFRYGRCPRLERGRKCVFSHTQTRENEENKNTRSKSFSPIRRNNNNNYYNNNNSNSQNTSNKYNTQHHTKTGGVLSGGVQSGGVCQTCGNSHPSVRDKKCFRCKNNTINFGTENNERRNSV